MVHSSQKSITTCLISTLYLGLCSLLKLQSIVTKIQLLCYGVQGPCDIDATYLRRCSNKRANIDWVVRLSGTDS